MPEVTYCMADFAAECVKDALALADAADNYCDRCGDIVQVNAIERAIRAERERATGKAKLEIAEEIENHSYLAGTHEMCVWIDGLTKRLREEGK